MHDKPGEKSLYKTAISNRGFQDRSREWGPSDVEGETESVSRARVNVCSGPNVMGSTALSPGVLKARTVYFRPHWDGVRQRRAA